MSLDVVILLVGHQVEVDEAGMGVDQAGTGVDQAKVDMPGMDMASDTEDMEAMGGTVAMVVAKVSCQF